MAAKEYPSCVISEKLEANCNMGSFGKFSIKSLEFREKKAPVDGVVTCIFSGSILAFHRIRYQESSCPVSFLVPGRQQLRCKGNDLGDMSSLSLFSQGQSDPVPFCLNQFTGGTYHSLGSKEEPDDEIMLRLSAHPGYSMGALSSW